LSVYDAHEARALGTQLIRFLDRGGQLLRPHIQHNVGGVLQITV
jgi:hypothetical protein